MRNRFTASLNQMAAGCMILGVASLGLVTTSCKSSTPASSDAGPKVITARLIKGDEAQRQRRSSTTYIEAQPGTTIEEGDQLCCGSGDAYVLELPDGSTIRMSKSTIVVLDQMRQQGSTTTLRLDLSGQGAVWVDAKEGCKVEVIANNAQVVTEPGTDFEMSSKRDDSLHEIATLKVFMGKATLGGRTKTSDSKVVSIGEQSQIVDSELKGVEAYQSAAFDSFEKWSSSWDPATDPSVVKGGAATAASDAGANASPGQGAGSPAAGAPGQQAPGSEGQPAGQQPAASQPSAGGKPQAAPAAGQPQPAPGAAQPQAGPGGDPEASAADGDEQQGEGRGAAGAVEVARVAGASVAARAVKVVSRVVGARVASRVVLGKVVRVVSRVVLARVVPARVALAVSAAVPGKAARARVAPVVEGATSLAPTRARVVRAGRRASPWLTPSMRRADPSRVAAGATSRLPTPTRAELPGGLPVGRLLLRVLAPTRVDRADPAGLQVREVVRQVASTALPRAAVSRGWAPPRQPLPPRASLASRGVGAVLGSAGLGSRWSWVKAPSHSPLVPAA